MKEADKIKVLAEKVMGWEPDVIHLHYHSDSAEVAGWRYVEGGLSKFVRSSDWNPYRSDADCMMLWDKFSEGKLTSLVHFGPIDGETWSAEYSVNQDKHIEAERPDRRTAMCECILATLEGE